MPFYSVKDGLYAVDGRTPPWKSGNDQNKADDKRNLLVPSQEQYDRTDHRSML